MKIKKITAALIAASVALCCLAGCGDDAKESKSSAEGTASEVVEEKIPETDEEWHEAMIRKSQTSYGNVSMLQEKLKAAQAGEQINISYLGGSITEGLTAGPEKCWAKLTYDHISQTYGTGDNVSFNNAGLSGTPSKLGVIRLDRDVLAYDPDICFVEYAVNDGGEGDYQMAYESIIRTLLENDCAVVLVFARTESGHTCQEYMQRQGEYYQLPMISYSDALVYMFDNEKMTWQDFSDDQSHPNEYGHTLVAEMVDTLIDSCMEQTAEEYTMPSEPLNELRCYGSKLYENDSLEAVDMGSWNTETDIARFTKGWDHPTQNTENQPIKFKFTGKFVYLLYQEAKQNLGLVRIVIYQDGELYDDMTFDPNAPSGWGNCQTKLIGMSAKNTEYEIEISMAEGYEDKYFAILGFGYTIDE